MKQAGALDAASGTWPDNTANLADSTLESQEARLQRLSGLTVCDPHHCVEAVARALQECSVELHIGPRGPLTPSISDEGELLLLRQRAGDVLGKLSEFPSYYHLCRSFFAASGTGAAAFHCQVGFRRRQQVVDGHGRLLILCASLLRELLSTGARYPLVGTPSATRNRLRVVRVLRALASTGELQVVPVSHTPPCEDACAADFMERMVRASLEEVQLPSHRCEASVTWSVLAGCIHHVMSTEVEGSALLVLQHLLLDFFCAPFPHRRRRLPTHTLTARARLFLEEPETCLVTCLGSALTHSRGLPCGSFFLPTVAANFSAHQDADTPYFILDGRGVAEKRCRVKVANGPVGRGRSYLVMLVVIDHEGGLLDFAHARPPLSDAARDRDPEGCDGSKGGKRHVDGRWTAAEQHDAQLEASKRLYEWAWANGVSVIVTPSHAPPVMKTFGVRYCDGGETCRDVKGRDPVFMVDEVDSAVFDAMLRRLRNWRRITPGGSGAGEDVCACPEVAVLRRWSLDLPECSTSAIIPCRFVAHGSLETIFSPQFPFTVSERGDGFAKKRGVLLQIDQVNSSGTRLQPPAATAVGDAGVMLLVSPTAHMQRLYAALLLKCVACILLAVDPSSAGRSWASECGLGFVRAGGCMEIALSRRMRYIAESLRCDTAGGSEHPIPASLSVDTPVLAAVLDVLSGVLCEVPRRVVSYVSSHHYPLRRAWLQFESDELQLGRGGRQLSMREAHDAPPLHVCIRDDLAFYDEFVGVVSDNREAQRRYFCKSDTESSGSDSDGDEESPPSVTVELCRAADLNGRLATHSFVEPVAVMAGVLRAALTFVRLVLSNGGTSDVSS